MTPPGGGTRVGQTLPEIAMTRHVLAPLLLLPVVLLLTFASPAASAQGCPPAGTNRAALTALKAANFAIADDGRRQKLAISLLACLESPDPELRDRLGFEALSSWMRADLLTIPTRAAIRDTLVARLDSDAPDTEGFAKPFAALTLSEVARTDLVTPWLTVQQRTTLVDASARYMESIRDYRGFDDREGWRHAVAHDADLMMQLARNRALEKAQLDRLLAAIATQVAPRPGHAYVYGEPERLARPVLFIAARGLITDAERAAWFQAITDPAPNARWTDAYSSTAGLARRHDVRAFLIALTLGGSDSESPAVKAMVADALVALKSFN
jgi:hypothetical protein